MLKFATSISLLLLHFLSVAQYDTLEIASWNVYLRPSILNDGQMSRVDSISSYMDQSGADILVLQEVFHRKARNRMIQNLSKKYPHHTSVGPKSFWGIPSGVMIFSKRKIDNEKRISFKDATGSDKMARKGAVAATFQFWKQNIHIIGTHMQAGAGKKRDAIRKKQLLRIKKFTQEMDSNDIFIFAGDFNISKTTKMFESLLDTLNCQTILPQGDLQATCAYRDVDQNETVSSPKWIDFILIRNKPEKIRQEKVWIDEPDKKIHRRKLRMSDHNPIFSKILIKRKQDKCDEE